MRKIVGQLYFWSAVWIGLFILTAIGAGLVICTFYDIVQIARAAR